MAIIVECTREGVKNKNTGANEQCIESVTVRHALATEDQAFATFADFKDLAKWKADRDLKKIIPLFQIEEIASANTEDTFYGVNTQYRTDTGSKITTFQVILGLCSHAALKSYDGKIMRVYEFTKAQEILGVNTEGAKIKGQKVKITVGMRVAAMPDKPAYTPVTLDYLDANEFELNGVVAKPTWSNLELNGIFDAEIVIVSATATNVTFKVDGGCAGDAVNSLEDANLTFTKPDGTPIVHTFVAADANGNYQFIGTGFATGDLVGTNGVVTQPEASYEGVDKVAIVIA